MKRIFWAVILLSVHMNVFSAPLEISAGLALHDSSLYQRQTEESLRLSYDGFSLGVNLGGLRYVTVSSSYEPDFDGPGVLRADAQLSHTFDTGGFATLSGEAGLRFSPGHIRFSCALGLQAALSYSLYASLFIPFSFSPYVSLSLGLESEYFSFEIYTTGSTFFEKTFQAVPIAGVDVEIGISESHWIILDAYIKLADYMDGPPLQITDLAARVGYRYRTDV